MRDILRSISKLLEQYNAYCYGGLDKALSGDESQLLDFLKSNELWGGAGSIADQALINTNDRDKLDSLLIQLGHEQMKRNLLNPRTKMWVEAFESWKKGGP